MKHDYKPLLEICHENSAMSKSLIDDFLMPYAMERESMQKEIDHRFAPYRQLIPKQQASIMNYLKTQYIGHRIFKEDGLIQKYLNHSALKRLNTQERSFLEFHAAHPWRFSFSVITGNPEKNFYLMQDVFTGDSYLLYSTGVTSILQEQPVVLWFNLIGFNGSCWQCYGPIAGYEGFEPDDIFFFATGLNPRIESDEDIMGDVATNPVPYMMLLTGARYPLTAHKKDQILQIVAEYDKRAFDASSLAGKDFEVKYAQGIYRLAPPKKWAEHPHFSTAYYDEDKKVLMLTALTDRGFQALVTALNKHGYDLEGEPDIRVNITMLTTAKNILGKDIRLNPYEELFTVKPRKEERESLDKLNNLIRLALPQINAGKEPDLEAIAQKAGMDVETARDVLEQVVGRINNLKSGQGGKKTGR